MVGRPRRIIVLGVGEDVGWSVLSGEVELVFLTHDFDSGRWGRTWKFQGVLLGLFAVQDIAEFEEIAVDQCGVSCKVATLHAWVAVLIKTGDGEKRDNVLRCDSLHVLGDPSDP